MYSNYYGKDLFDGLFDFKFDDLFSTFVKHPHESLTSTETKENGVLIKLHVPGHNKESLKISVSDNQINVNSIKEKTAPGIQAVDRAWKTSKNYYDLTAIDAKCKDGILTIFIPKKQIQAAESQQIEIK